MVQVTDSKQHEALRARLQHEFADQRLLALALTHTAMDGTGTDTGKS